jgi:outer membrane immunogenic protein
VRRLVLAIILSSAFTSVAPAVAADLGPQYKAPLMTSTFNWGGFYAGVNLGGAWDTESLHQANIPAGPGPGVDATIHSSGVAGGGQLGFNWVPTPNWLVGIEADVSGAALKGTGIGFFPLHGIETAVTSWTDKLDAFGTARGRFGYVANNWLFYGTGGFAWSDDTLTRTQLVGNALSPVEGFVVSNDATRTGWAAGGGIEWGFARNWAARLEYLHLDLSDPSFSFTTTSDNGTTVGRSVEEGRLKVDTVRVGVSYLFN